MVAKDTSRVLSPSDFFQALPVALAPRLPVELRGFETRRGPGRLLKLDYGRPESHFEAWHHTGGAGHSPRRSGIGAPAKSRDFVGSGRFEVGLHLEGSPRANARVGEALRARLIEVKGRLPNAELEPWDRGWIRLYETFAAVNLSTLTLERAAERLAAYITTLQPMLEEIK